MRIPNYLAYVVLDNEFNRKWYPFLVGKGFAAPPNYANVLPYRRIQTEGYEAPTDYIPKPEKSD